MKEINANITKINESLKDSINKQQNEIICINDNMNE
jgi:hypothetical protein